MDTFQLEIVASSWDVNSLGPQNIKSPANCAPPRSLGCFRSSTAPGLSPHLHVSPYNDPTESCISG